MKSGFVMNHLPALACILFCVPSIAPAQPWRPLGPFGGDAQDVNFSPTKTNVLLAGIAPAGNPYGSLYRSSDGGATWAQVTGFGAQSAYDIEFAADGTAWVAGYNGVWVSTDDGLTFTMRDSGLGNTYAVAIDPSNPQVLWAGLASGAVMKSVNGGTNWANVSPGTSMACDAIAINPTNSLQVMAVFDGGFSGGAVYFTPDGGATWNNVSAGLPPYPDRAVRYDRGRWFVGAGQIFASEYSGLWRSTNNGQTWTQLASGWPTPVAGGVAIDPNNPDVILAATPDGLHKSSNGGQTWTISAGGSSGYSLASVRFAPGSSGRVAAGASSYGVILSDNAAAKTRVSSTGIGALNAYSVAVNPANPVEMAMAFQSLNNGGVYASTNGGVTWQLQSAPGTRYSYVKFDSGGTLYALSTGPTTIAQEGVYRRNASGTWTLLGPDQGPNYETELVSIDFGSTNQNLFIAGGDDFVSGAGTAWRSTNAGGLWTKTLVTSQSAETERVLILPDGTDQLVLAGVQTFSGQPVNGVYRSIDGGATWNQVTNTGLPSTVWIYDLTTAPTNSHTVFAADGSFSGGGIYRSTDAGATWSTYLTGYNVRGIAIDPTSADDVYFWAVFSGPVYHASKNGTQVVAASDGLSGGAQQIIAVSKPAPRLLVAGNTGVYELSLAPPILRINWAGNRAVLTWTNAAFALQSSPSAVGNFTTIPGASSPYTNITFGPRQFFRLAK
ncbi:MAG TPA: hypothetical protein VMB80_17275 [Candidatus Acidoferrum sp.]|nr:hypothetical protein [Candidatus Acidoferrum sp.]